MYSIVNSPEGVVVVGGKTGEMGRERPGLGKEIAERSCFKWAKLLHNMLFLGHHDTYGGERTRREGGEDVPHSFLFPLPQRRPSKSITDLSLG